MGLVDAEPLSLTAKGREVREAIEAETNQRAQETFDVLDEAAGADFLAALQRLPGNSRVGDPGRSGVFASDLAGRFDPFDEVDGHVIAGLFADGVLKIGFDREFVSAVSQGHERALERMVIDGPANPHETAGAEELRGPVRDEVGPTAFGRALLEGCGELFVKCAHG